MRSAVDDAAFPPDARHGSIARITAPEAKALREHWAR
jgi:hypothetical protein